MADFCKDCSEETFGGDFKDLASITSLEDFAEGKAAVVLCEGCGPIQVDPNGKCLGNCLNKNHGAGGEKQ